MDNQIQTTQPKTPKKEWVKPEMKGLTIEIGIGPGSDDAMRSS